MREESLFVDLYTSYYFAVGFQQQAFNVFRFSSVGDFLRI